jgi:F-type H+-transporting ATPase subunit a
MNEFKPPTIEEFFPPGVLFVGTWFEMNRVVFFRIFSVVALIVLFWAGTRKMSMVPGRFQGFVEWLLDLVYSFMARRVGGKRRQAVLAASHHHFLHRAVYEPDRNYPGAQHRRHQRYRNALVLAVAAYFAFMYAGLRKHPVAFLKNSLLPPGVPWPLYIIVTPIEFVSTFILRPVTLTCVF